MLFPLVLWVVFDRCHFNLSLRSQLPEDARVQDIAGYITSVMYGLAVLARRGKTKEELKVIADMAVSTLPVRG